MESNLESKMLTTPKLKELLRSKSRCKQLLLAAITTNFVVFRCMVPKKWHKIVSTYKYIYGDGDGLEKRPIFAAVRKKRMNKVCHFKANEKRN